MAPGARADDPEAVARDLVAVHATNPASVHLSLRARLTDPARDATERALYDDRTLVRMLGMRRTMFVVPVELAPIVQAACTRSYAARERRRLVRMVEDAGIATDGEAWVDGVECATLRALDARGEASGTELSTDVPALRAQVHVGVGKKWETKTAMTSRVLSVLGMEGGIVRGRPRGTWISGQYAWATLESWLGAPLEEPAPAAARTELARRWLQAYGPGTLADLKWWSGWTVAQTRAALTDAGAVEVALDRARGFALGDDLERDPTPEPWCAFLPSLDTTVMGWKERDWYLGDHVPALFDTSGNAGPTVWWDGRVVGSWAQRPDGSVVFGLLEDVGAEGAAAVAAEAERLTDWFGGERAMPRFPTPLQRELAAD
jgi:Winged helix DNA-binding domain